jgi:Transposase DDE domain/Insertion element 4 transposase N-terminal
LLAKAYPVKNVRIALAQTGKMSRRERDFPNHIVVYFVILLAFFARSSYDAILELLLQGVELVFGSISSIKQLNKSTLSRGRERLGWEPFALLFDSSKPIATEKTKGAWYSGFRLVILDGSTFDAADTPENARFFGYSAGSHGKGAFPKVQATFLTEAGTHLIFGAAFSDDGRQGETALAYRLVPKLKKGYLLLCDRLYPSFELLEAVRQRGTHVLWRVKKDFLLDQEKLLSDGSYLSKMYEYKGRHRKGSIVVRVVPYKIAGTSETYRLLTSLLDPKQAPAIELASLYHERWEIENTNDELKVHLKPPKVPLRSKKPELVLQELYGYVLAHSLVRRQMHEAALEGDEDPDQLSFTHTVEIIRSKLPAPGNFSP